MSFSDTPVLRPISNKRKPVVEETNKTAPELLQYNNNFNDSSTDESGSWNQTRPPYQSKKSSFNGGRQFCNKGYFRFFQSFQETFYNVEQGTHPSPSFHNRKGKTFNNCNYPKLPYKVKNGYPSMKSLNPRNFPNGYRNFFAYNDGNNTFSDDIGREEYGNWTTNETSSVRKEKVPKKLKILRHSPAPPPAKITPKKFIEKIAKFNKESLKNIINNPSKYDGLLQKLGREQAVAVSSTTEDNKVAIKEEDEDKNNFEIIPDDTVEVSADFFDFLQMDTAKDPIEVLDAMPFPIEELAELNKPIMENGIDLVQSKPDLMDRLKTAESIKTNHAKNFNKNTKNNTQPIQRNDPIKSEDEEITTGNELKINAKEFMKNACVSPAESGFCEDITKVANYDINNETHAKQELENFSETESNRTDLNSTSICHDGSNFKDDKNCPNSESVSVNMNPTEKAQNPIAVGKEKKTSLLSLVRKRPSRVDSAVERRKTSISKEKKTTTPSNSRSPKRKNPRSSSSSSSRSHSSSSSSTSSSSTSSSSSSSSSTSPSNHKTQKLRHRRLLDQKLNIKHIIETFESRLLPNLSKNLVQRYREKYSKSMDTKLIFICRICRNKQLKERLQRDLNSTEKKKAIIILMREVTNVINRQPKEDEVQHKTPASDDNKSTVNPIGESIKLDLDCNIESADVAKNLEIQEHQSVDETSPHMLIAENVYDAEMQLKCEAEDNVATNEKSEPLVTEISNEKLHEKTVQSELNNQSSSSNIVEPTHLIPFMPPLPFLPMQPPPSSAFANFQSFANMSNIPNNFHPMNMSAMQQHQPQQQIFIPGPWLSNIHAIDCRISDLVKRKQFINEMITKLQQDSMELDVQIVDLQKEKYMLLNAAFSANASNTNPPKVSAPKNATKKARIPPKLRKCVKKNGCNKTIPKKGTSRGKRPQKKSLLRVIASEETHQSDKENSGSRIVLSTNALPSAEVETTHFNTFDYTHMPTGELDGINSAANQLCVYQDCILATTEDGHLYRYNMKTLEMVEECKKHDSTITQMNFCAKNLVVYTTCLDGYFKATPLNDLKSEENVLHLNDQIQSLEIQWDCAFIGARSGNIYTCNTMTKPLAATNLYMGDSSVMAIKATKEGPRKILIISSKGSAVLIRDALNGLLLRSIHLPDNLFIYGFLMDESNLYCGTQRAQVLKLDFTTGTPISTFYCGNGVVAMRLYKSKYLIVACYDGFIYILNKFTGDKVETLPAAGRLPLTLEVFGNKIITSSKDKAIKIIDIPSSIVNG